MDTSGSAENNGAYLSVCLIEGSLVDLLVYSIDYDHGQSIQAIETQLYLLPVDI